MSGQWYNRKWLAVSLHVLFWALIFSFPYLLRPVIENNASHRPQINYTSFYYLSFADNFIRLMLFYANAYLFIPHLAYKKKYGQYLLVLAIALGIMLVLNQLFFNLFIKEIAYKVWNFFVFNLPFFFFIVIASTAFRVIKDRIQETQRLKERETENLKTELSFLRSQVSPHFMFNIMNNMVALARKKSELLEPSLIKLSSLLRYMLYETEEKVPLQKEIEYLQSYIDLQRQRFGNNIIIKACLETANHNYEIEPMLLIPFVENAFKHGAGAVVNAEIHIDLKVENNILSFSVRNTFEEMTAETKDKTSGIGLANVQRRLALLYHNKHSLLITKQNNWFIASLQIVLN
jgi:two-component system, LytTR family, sensor kinase